MEKTIDRVTVIATGISDSEREVLERDLTAYAQARLDETAARDAATMAGVAEFERGEFIGIEEWRKELDQLKADLRDRHAK